MSVGSDRESFNKLENLVFALVTSLIYMIFLVFYVKSNFNLTLDVRDELVIGFWGLIIGIIYATLCCFTRTYKKEIK